MLEQIAYEIPRNEQRQPTYFIVGDLESLSASALYYGNSSSMSFIDLPMMKIQAHCHEGENGTTHFKDYNGEKIQMLDSYQFAMGDLYAKSLGLKTGTKGDK